MKKSLLFVAALGMTIAANAQTESAFIPTASGEPFFTEGDAVAISAGTVLCESANITMKQAFDDTFKRTSMAAEADPCNQIVIDGVTYSMPAGIQCQTNPKENSLLTGGQQSGAVFQFDVKTDGMLYVFAKLTYNKNYYVWEGDVPNGAGSAVAYTLAAWPVSTGVKTGYTLPGDELGYYVVGTGYDNGTMYYQASQCISIANGGAAVDAEGANVYDASWTSGNALGVIAFPVYAEAEKYYVNACGSKVTCNGYVFVPGATEVASIEASKKGSDAGISSVVANSSVVTYNILGQQVAADTKGLVIRNGKKAINF